MRKICVPVMSRANWGRLKMVLKAIQENKGLELQLIIGGSALLPRFGVKHDIEKSGFKIAGEIWCTIEGDKHECMATTTGLLTTQLVQYFNILKPDIVLVHADRYEMLAIATAASYMGIPLAHTQGGEVSGNIDDKVRNSITMLSDIHFPATVTALWRLKDYGICPDRIFNVGCPTIDFLVEMNQIEPNPDPYLMVVMHPVTTDNENARKMSEILHTIDYFGMKTIWIHSNVDAGNTQVNEHVKSIIKAHNMQNIEFLDSISPEEYYSKMKNTMCLIGNTSSGLREGLALGTPYVCLGDRQANREHGSNVKFVKNYDFVELKEAIEWQMGRKYEYDGRFGDGTAGKQIAKILSTIEVKSCKY
jgi:UDP-hydrolysing UDP-N-acetyl-D-glucosamine 2-epimerase